MKNGPVKIGDYVCMNDHDYSQGFVDSINEHTEPQLLTIRIIYPNTTVIVTTKDEVLHHSGQ